MLYPISQTEFDALAKQGYNRIPLVAETFCRPRHAAFALPETRK